MQYDDPAGHVDRQVGGLRAVRVHDLREHVQPSCWVGEEVTRVQGRRDPRVYVVEVAAGVGQQLGVALTGGVVGNIKLPQVLAVLC